MNLITFADLITEHLERPRGFTMREQQCVTTDGTRLSRGIVAHRIRRLAPLVLALFLQEIMT
jgi:hypothetical protein